MGRRHEQAAAAAALEAKPEPEQKPRKLADRMLAVWQAVMDTTDKKEGYRLAEVFERLPPPDELPVYYEVVAEPMDLDTVREHLLGGKRYKAGWKQV